MPSRARTLGKPFKTRWLTAAAVAVAISLVPLAAHAQSASPLLTKAPPGGGYPDPGPIGSWLDMVSATQAAQPSWMTPLVTVTPRLEQEFRFDFYEPAKRASRVALTATANTSINYGGPGGGQDRVYPGI